jgi:hypothetical protein
VEPPAEEVSPQDLLSTERLRMIAYPATLDISRNLIQVVLYLPHSEREIRGAGAPDLLASSSLRDRMVPGQA